jgi:hypothetical protein
VPRKYIPVTEQKDKDKGKRLHIYAPLSLLKRMEKYLTDTGATMTSVVLVAMEDFLSKRGY